MTFHLDFGVKKESCLFFANNTLLAYSVSCKYIKKVKLVAVINGKLKRFGMLALIFVPLMMKFSTFSFCFHFTSARHFPPVRCNGFLLHVFALFTFPINWRFLEGKLKEKAKPQTTKKRLRFYFLLFCIFLLFVF